VFFSFIKSKNTEKINAECYLCGRIFRRNPEEPADKTDKTIEK